MVVRIDWQDIVRHTYGTMQPNQSNPLAPEQNPNQNVDNSTNPASQYAAAPDPWTVAPPVQQPASISQPMQSQGTFADQYQDVHQQTAAEGMNNVQQQPTAAEMVLPQPSKPKSPFELEYEAALNQPEKKKSPLKLIIFIVAGLIVLGAGAAAFIWWQAMNDPQARLYRALENHMSTRYIKQDFDMKLTAPMEVDVTLRGESDFSDPAKPKSFIEYEMKTSGIDSEYEQAGEVIAIDQNTYYAKLKKAPVLLGAGGDDAAVVDTWYQADNDDYISAMLLDTPSSRIGINTVTGQVLVGNFNDAARRELMQFIKDRNVYPIASSEVVEISEKKTTHYTIDLSGKLVEELNQKAIKALNISEDDSASSGRDADMKLELWVDNNADRIIQAKVTSKADGNNGTEDTAAGSNTIILSYPTNVSKIKKPEVVRSLPWEM